MCKCKSVTRSRLRLLPSSSEASRGGACCLPFHSLVRREEDPTYELDTVVCVVDVCGDMERTSRVHARCTVTEAGSPRTRSGCRVVPALGAAPAIDARRLGASVRLASLPS